MVIKFYHPILPETCNLILIPIYDRIKRENRILQEKPSIIYYIDVDWLGSFLLRIKEIQKHAGLCLFTSMKSTSPQDMAILSPVNKKAS